MRDTGAIRTRSLTSLLIILAITATFAQDKKKTNKPVRVVGTAVDAQTGEPLKGIIVQGGRVGKDGKITWGYTLTRNGRSSQFSTSIRWDDGWRARVMAPGYKAKPILSKRPEGDVVRDLVLKLEPGETIEGRLLNAEGKPVANGGVFVVGGRSINMYQGKAWTNYDKAAEDKTVARATTDKDGRFKLTGFDDEFHRIAFSNDDINLWVISASQRPKDNEWVVRLPKTYSLTIKYDIGGGPEPAEFFIQMGTWEMDGWKYTESNRRVKVKNGGELELKNLTAATYVISRTKSVRMSDRGQSVFCEQRRIQVGPKNAVADYTRKTGSSVAGRIVGFPKSKNPDEAIEGAFIFVRASDASGDPRDLDYKKPTFDALSCDRQGSFTTEQLAPGTYKIVAYAYQPEPRTGRFTTGIRLPTLVGEAKVTVKGSRPPEPVQVELKPLPPRKSLPRRR